MITISNIYAVKDEDYNVIKWDKAVEDLTKDYTYISGTVKYDIVDEKLFVEVIKVEGIVDSESYTFYYNRDYEIITETGIVKINFLATGTLPDDNSTFTIYYKVYSTDIVKYKVYRTTKPRTGEREFIKEITTVDTDGFIQTCTIDFISSDNITIYYYTVSAVDSSLTETDVLSEVPAL